MDETSLKLDRQDRTSFQGFLYSNSDPANRRDRSPAELSYIDFVFESQRCLLEHRLSTLRGSERQAAELDHATLLETMARRQLRTERLRPVLVLRSSADAPPLFGEELSYLTALLVFMGTALTLPTIGPFISLIGISALLISYLVQHVELDPYDAL